MTSTPSSRRQTLTVRCLLMDTTFVPSAVAAIAQTGPGASTSSSSVGPVSIAFRHSPRSRSQILTA